MIIGKQKQVNLVILTCTSTHTPLINVAFYLIEEIRSRCPVLYRTTSVDLMGSNSTSYCAFSIRPRKSLWFNIQCASCLIFYSHASTQKGKKEYLLMFSLQAPPYYCVEVFRYAVCSFSLAASHILNMCT